MLPSTVPFSRMLASSPHTTVPRPHSPRAWLPRSTCALTFHVAEAVAHLALVNEVALALLLLMASTIEAETAIGPALAYISAAAAAAAAAAVAAGVPGAPAAPAVL